jgi:hypothetical protein
VRKRQEGEVDASTWWGGVASRRAAHDGRFTLGEMLRRASRRPTEVELVDGEFWFITAHLADTTLGNE